MNAQTCLQILRDIKDVSFASVDEKGMPHNRIIDVMLVEDHKLYFCTARGKDFYNQITKNPHIAIAGLNRDFQMVRLHGTVKQLKEQKVWIDRIFGANPVMNDVYPGDSRYILEPFVVDNGQIEFFDLSKHPIQRQSFRLNQEVLQEHGFFITDSCIGCGTCQRNCPQQCIQAGTPFVIEQDHCLHCGLCYENCPVQAIVRRGE